MVCMSDTRIVHYKLTHSKQNTNFSASPIVGRLSWAISIHHHPPTWFRKSHVNAILPSTSGSSKCRPPGRIYSRKSVCVCLAIPSEAVFEAYRELHFVISTVIDGLNKNHDDLPVVLGRVGSTHSYSWRRRFKPQLVILAVFFSGFQQSFYGTTDFEPQIMPRSLPSTYFSVYYSLIFHHSTQYIH